AFTNFGSLSAGACVLRYARQVRSPAPAAFASDWQCASAPSRPPRLAPLPVPVLVTKNVTSFGVGCMLAQPAIAMTPAIESHVARQGSDGTTLLYSGSAGKMREPHASH